MSTGGALTTGEPQPNQVDVLERGDKKTQTGRAAGDDPGVPYWYASEQRKGKLLCSRVLENSVAQSARAAGSSWTFVARRHPGVLATKVRYFGVKSTNVPLGADGHQTC